MLKFISNAQKTTNCHAILTCSIWKCWQSQYQCHFYNKRQYLLFIFYCS